jgi:hypothetical protein
MKQLMECLLVEIREIRELVEVGQEKIKALQEKTKAKMEANRKNINQDRRNEDDIGSITPASSFHTQRVGKPRP